MHQCCLFILQVGVHWCYVKMGQLSLIVQLSMLVAFIAMFFTLPAFEQQRAQLSSLLSTCPLHWFDGSTDTSSDEAASQTSIIRTDSSQLFTSSDLKQLDGNDENTGVCISILGSVYDVSTGRQYYGSSGSYHFFAGEHSNFYLVCNKKHIICRSFLPSLTK